MLASQLNRQAYAKSVDRIDSGALRQTLHETCTILTPASLASWCLQLKKEAAKPSIAAMARPLPPSPSPLPRGLKGKDIGTEKYEKA